MSAERNILMVEDNEDDVILIQRALRKGGITAPLRVVRDGDEAVDYLAATIQPSAQAVAQAGADTVAGTQAETASVHPLPTIVLLDLKLPKRNGFEVLQWIRNHETLATLPVVVFTTSTQDVDLERAYACGANSYLRKPATVEETTALLKAVNLYWLTYNQHPPCMRAGS